MMNPTVKYHILIFILVALLPAGCIDSQLEICPPLMNTTLYFSLKDKDNNDVFSATVDHVDLFVYDAMGRKITPLGEEGIRGGKRLRLEPGTYSVVAWANATPLHTRIVTQESAHWLNSSENYLLTANGTVEDGDPLYYAPLEKGKSLTLTVPLQGEVEATVPFTHAHVQIEVTVEGIEADLLKMELTEITSRYSFGLEAHGNRVSYIRNVHPTGSDKKRFNTSFHVPLFDAATPTQLLVNQDDGGLIVPSISIRELLGNKIDIEKLTHLPIRITFDDQLRVAIYVDLPEWGEDMVKPNI